MTKKDEKATELLRDFLACHETETSVGAEIAVSNERRMRVWIYRKPPPWLEFLRDIWGQWSGR